MYVSMESISNMLLSHHRTSRNTLLDDDWAICVYICNPGWFINEPWKIGAKVGTQLVPNSAKIGIQTFSEIRRLPEVNYSGGRILLRSAIFALRSAMCACRSAMFFVCVRQLRFQELGA